MHSVRTAFGLVETNQLGQSDLLPERLQQCNQCEGWSCSDTPQETHGRKSNTTCMMLGLREAVVFVRMHLVCQLRPSLVTVATIPQNRKCSPGSPSNTRNSQVQVTIFPFLETVQEEHFYLRLYGCKSVIVHAFVAVPCMRIALILFIFQ